MRPQTAARTATAAKRNNAPQIIVTLLLLGCSLPVMTAPAAAPHRHRHSRASTQLGAPENLPDSWWQFPCSKPDPNSQTGGTLPCNTQNNSKPVKGQIKIFYDHYNNHATNMEKFLSELSCNVTIISGSIQQEDYKWIPKPPKPRKYRNNFVKALVDFHKDIQIYAIALNHLQEISPNTSSTKLSNNVEQRKIHLATQSYNLRSLMCEVEDRIQNSCENKNLERFQKSHRGIGRTLNAHPGHSDLCIQDVNVLQAFQKCLKGWYVVFNEEEIKKVRGMKRSGASKKSKKH